ncbi:MAG: outer membrane protein assembly factor BamC, partial [Pseudomonadales bacterium]
MPLSRYRKPFVKAKSVAGRGRAVAPLCSVLLGAGLLAGCSTSVLTDNALYGENGLIHDRTRDYQKAQQGKALEIPPHLKAKQTQDILDIPALGVAGEAIDDVKRPEYFYADSGSESVNLKSSAKGKTLIVDEPIGLVWSKAQQFMEFNNLGISSADPASGSIVSDWILVKGDENSAIGGWLKKITLQRVKEDTQNKLRIALKPDTKDPRRTEISMAHVLYPASQEVANIDWNKEANDLSYKQDMLYELLRFMSKATNGTQGSGYLASRVQNTKRPGAVLFGRNANGKPALKISGGIDQAWALVNQSLDFANIDVGTRDREDKAFYLTFTSVTPRVEKEQSFFEWLHGDRGPITLSSFGFATEDDASAKEGISYSAKGQVSSSKELSLTDPQHPANQDGYKIWLGGKVVYNFSRGFNKGFFNSQTNLYELTAPYQVRLKQRGDAVFITVLDDKGKEAA